jgi:hypothetical protein
MMLTEDSVVLLSIGLLVSVAQSLTDPDQTCMYSIYRNFVDC